MEQKTVDLIVLGGGPAGHEAAVIAAGNGLQVAQISNQKPGGRAVWGSLVPSKVWLTAAENAGALQHSAYHALGNLIPNFDLDHLNVRIVAQSEAASKRYRHSLNAAGVAMITGKGALLDAETVLVETENKGTIQLKARNILIATGSEPAFTPDVRPVPPRIFAPRHAAALPELPKSLLVVGGGVTGVEYAYAFAALGAAVTLLHNGPQLLPRLDAAVAAAFEAFLQKRFRIHIQKNQAVKMVMLEDQAVVAKTEFGQSFRADYAFLGTGRKPDLSFYDPATLPFALAPDGALAINEHGQTSYPSVYAAGDVAGAPMTANKAMLQARVAVAHMLNLPAPGTSRAPLVEMAYTHPPVGQIGHMHPEKSAHFVEKSYSSLLKAHLEGETEGLLRIKVDDKTGNILGAAAFGVQAAEVLGILQIAIHHGIPYHKLRAFPLAHPSIGELLTAW